MPITQNRLERSFMSNHPIPVASMLHLSERKWWKAMSSRLFMVNGMNFISTVYNFLSLFIWLIGHFIN
jgi:hypothetical protein